MTISLSIENHSWWRTLVAHTLRVGSVLCAVEVHFVALGLIPCAVLALLVGSVQLCTLFSHLREEAIERDVFELSTQVLLVRIVRCLRGFLSWLFLYVSSFRCLCRFLRLCHRVNLHGPIGCKALRRLSFYN